MLYNSVNGIEMVNEMTETDLYNESSIIDFEEGSIMEMVESIEEIDAQLFYTEQMVPVFKDGEKYLIEHENLMKVVAYYLENDVIMDEEQAIEKICEANEIDINESSVYVVLESEENYRKNIFFIGEKLKKEKDPKKKQVLKMRLAGFKARLEKLKGNKKVKTLRKKNIKRKKK